MSYSLQLTHGDFATSGAQLSTATDATKLVQDLRCFLLERMGTDPAHPDYGSLIDGGRMPDGTLVPGLIATDNDAAAVNALQAEFQRIVSAYRAQQLSRAQTDRSAYNRVTLTPGEVLIAVTSLNVTQQADGLMATVTLQTAAGTQVVEFPVGS